MKIRVLSSLVGLMVLAAVIFAYFTPIFNIAVVVMVSISLYEIYHCFGVKVLPILIVELILGVILAFSAVEWIDNFIVPTFFLFILLIAFYMVLAPEKTDIHQLGGMVFFSTIILFCFYPFVYFKSVFENLPNYNDAVYVMLLCMAIGWGSDAFAYFVGRAIGKRKLSPKISPNKTIEGALGGIFGSLLFVIIMTICYINIVAVLGFETMIKLDVKTILTLVPISIVGTGLGVLGDLFASSIKRQCQIKDFGSAFPGHGGVLDRFDSVLFIAPMMVIILDLLMYN